MKSVIQACLLGALLVSPAFAQQNWPFVLFGPVQGYQPSIQAPQVQPPGTQARNPYLPDAGVIPPPPLPSKPASPNPSAPQENSTLSDLGKSLRNTFTEEEIDLLFQYMKDSVIAAFKGEEVVLPPDLAFKLEVVLARMKRESSVYMEKLIKQLEEDLKRSLKEKLAPPSSDRVGVTP